MIDTYSNISIQYYIHVLNNFRMPFNIQRQFTPSQRMFLCSLKLRGLEYPDIENKFSAKFGVLPPIKDGLNKMAKNLKLIIQ